MAYKNKEDVAEYQKRYRNSHKEHKRVYNKEYAAVNYQKRIEYYREYYAKNRERILENHRKYFSVNREKWKTKYIYERDREPLEIRRGRSLKKLYGITSEEYNSMVDKQNGLCAICGSPEKTFDSNTKQTKVLSVDHNHETGQIRGLLCNSCNRGIGLIGDSPEKLLSAIKYMLDSNGQSLDKFLAQFTAVATPGETY